MTKEQDFWTRRRAAVAAEEMAGNRLESSESDTPAQFDEMSDSEVLEHLDLPDPDSLGLGDDFSVFMRGAVPDRIRRRALRALWRTNPVLANADGLVDYGADYTDGTTVVENLQTAYQVGRGMLSHLENLVASEPSAPPDASPDPMPDPPGEPVDTEPEAQVVADNEREERIEVSPVPRRMVFVFESDTA